MKKVNKKNKFWGVNDLILILVNSFIDKRYLNLNPSDSNFDLQYHRFTEFECKKLSNFTAPICSALSQKSVVLWVKGQWSDAISIKARNTFRKAFIHTLSLPLERSPLGGQLIASLFDTVLVFPIVTRCIKLNFETRSSAFCMESGHT